VIVVVTEAAMTVVETVAATEAAAIVAVTGIVAAEDN